MDFATPDALPAGDRSREQLRQALRALRDGLPQRVARERALDTALAAQLRATAAHCIGAYCRSRGEYDALAVLQRVGAELRWPWRIALPVVQAERRAMRFCAWQPGQALRRGAYGIDEPADCTEVVEPDLLLLPCLGFTAARLRLGYGGGYYDRYLEHRQVVRTIGLAFDACRVEGLLPQPHDRLLDLVLTESGRYPAR